MTINEAKMLLESLRPVFTVARITDPETNRVWEINENGEFAPADTCYHVWKRGTACEHCTTLNTCREKVITDKYELLDKNLYHITSKPIEVDGRPFALELVMMLDSADQVEKTGAMLHEQARNMEIINILASEYSSVYYIDLRTDELDPYTMNAETESEFGQIFRSGIRYSDAFKLYVETLVYAPDRENMLRAGSIPNIISELRGKKTFLTTYRSENGGDPHYCEMKFVKVGDAADEPVAVALGFSDRNEELKREKILERNQEIVQTLSDEYTSVYHVDLETGEMTISKLRPEMQVALGDRFHQGIHFAEALQLFIAGQVQNSDYHELLRFGSADYIRSLLSEQNIFTRTYRVGTEEDFRYNEMKLVKANKGSAVTSIVLGIADKDEEVRARMKEMVERRRNTEIIEILASEYSSVYYIDLRTDELDPYTMNEETESEFGQIFRSGIQYSDAFRLYVETLVHAEDREAMVEAGSIPNIIRELQTKKTFITTYRSETSGEPHYCEMKFVKVGDGEPTEVALGFADKDEEIRAEMARKAEIDRNNEIIEILASEYTSVYYIDLTTDELTPYTMNEETENQFGVLFKHMKYSDAFRMYVDTLIAPEDKTMMLRAGSVGNIIKELRHKKTFLTTYRSYNGGDPRYCEMKFVKVGTEDGPPKAVALGFADKDDELRKRIEEETARKRNTEIIEILASEYTSVYYIDLTTDELDPYTMNEETESEFGQVFRSGIQYSEAFRLYVNTMVHPADREKMLRAGSIYNILLELNDKKTFITTYRSGDDEESHYCEMKFVKVGDDENPQAVALGFSVIDEAYRRELADKQREAFINGLADDYEVVFHVEHDTHFIEIIRITDAFASRNPFTPEQHLYEDYLHSLSANVVEEDRAALLNVLSLENVDREFRKESAFFHNYRISRPGGEIAYYQLKLIHTGNWATDRNFLIGVHNMDELMRAQVAQETMLQDARLEAEAANRAKSRFLFNMSHDIRTPMNAIIGFNAMAQKHMDDPVKLLDCLEKVNLSSQHLLSIINDVLDMARIESGKVTIDEQPVSITESAEALVSIVRQSVKDKALTLHTNFSQIVHDRVYADELRVNRVMMNVVNNAIKYTGEGGSVSYTVRELPCDRPGYGSYEFLISDTGIGMSEEYLSHIFEAFTRESSSTVSGIQGTGLGMAITKELVDLMHGHIHVESKPGKGTNVKLHLDFRIADDAAVAGSAVSAADASILKGKRVLLVEDNELNREIAGDILEELGLVVDMAVNGAEAVEKCAAVRDAKCVGTGDCYDFILMDIQMPVMDGFEATRRIRNFECPYSTGAHCIPIIAMTANAFAEDKKAAMDAGMDAHLSKPINVEELVKTLAGLIMK